VEQSGRRFLGSRIARTLGIGAATVGTESAGLRGLAATGPGKAAADAARREFGRARLRHLRGRVGDRVGAFRLLSRGAGRTRRRPALRQGSSRGAARTALSSALSD